MVLAFCIYYEVSSVGKVGWEVGIIIKISIDGG
jgi:hypothetical protein